MKTYNEKVTQTCAKTICPNISAQINFGQIHFHTKHFIHVSDEKKKGVFHVENCVIACK